MKIPEKTNEKKGKKKTKKLPKAKKEHVLIVAQEIKFARLLSGNEKKTRDRVLKNLKKWLLNCFEKKYEFKEDDFIRVWKGLFYAVWMSDKPLVQEELCDSIAAVLDQFPPEQVKHAMLMVKAGFKVLATEWYGIDYHRMDKFLMLVRRYLRGSLRVLLRGSWSLKSCQLYSKMLMTSDGIFALKTPHYARNSLSMLLHVTDCYLEELAKVSDGDIPPDSLVELLRPFCVYMCGGAAPGLCAAARRLLTALLRQSEAGLRYQHATRAWKQMGCPQGGPEALELVSDEEDDDENGDDSFEDDDQGGDKPLDPRAGRVDVELASLPVPATQLTELLRSLLPTTASKAHKRAKICMQRFEQLSRDEYPLRERAPSPPAEGETPVKPKQSAHALHKLEKKLAAASDDLALRGLSRKHRKRLLAKSRAGQSIVEEMDTIKLADPANTAVRTLLDITGGQTGDWQVEVAEPPKKKLKTDTSNKENQNKRPKRKAHADGDKKRKTHDKINGDATNKRQKVAKTDKAKNTDSKKAEKTAANDSKSEVVVKKKSSKSPVKLNGVKTKELETEIKTRTAKIENGVKTKHNKDGSPVKTAVIVKNKPKLIVHNKDIVSNDKKPKQKVKNEKLKAKKSLNVENSDGKQPKFVNKVKNFQKQSKNMESINKKFESPKRVKFVLKNNSMQGHVDYYKSVRQSPSIPFDSSKQPSKTNLKPSMPSPINPFFKKKLKLQMKK